MAIAEAPPRARMSVAEFKSLPEGPPYYEYERGEVILMPRPHPNHNDAVGELFHVLRRFLRQHGLGRVFMDCEVEVLPDVIYAPDLFFLASQSAATYDPESGDVIGPPDLIVEVVSPRSGQTRDRVTKFRVYREAGVKWYWMIDPVELSIEEYELVEERYVRTASIEPGEPFQPGVFPGLEIDLCALMAPEAPKDAEPSAG